MLICLLVGFPLQQSLMYFSLFDHHSNIAVYFCLYLYFEQMHSSLLGVFSDKQHSTLLLNVDTEHTNKSRDS